MEAGNSEKDESEGERPASIVSPCDEEGGEDAGDGHYADQKGNPEWCIVHVEVKPEGQEDHHPKIGGKAEGDAKEAKGKGRLFKKAKIEEGKGACQSPKNEKEQAQGADDKGCRDERGAKPIELLSCCEDETKREDS